MESTSNPSLLHQRRRAAVSGSGSGGGRLVPDVDPPPNPPRVLQFAAFGLIVFLGCLQLFLPATHFRHPDDPHRNWIPFHPSTSPMGDGDDTAVLSESIHVFSSLPSGDCPELRMLAVLLNSTLSNARLPENVHFHIFLPEGVNEKSSFYKMKLLFPDSSIDMVGLKKVKENLRTALPEWEWEDVFPSLHELIPLVIPVINPTLSRFIYISSDTMIKGNIEELFGLDLGTYAIAAANDCNRKLGDYVNIDIANAVQRTAAKSWVSHKPYSGDSCTLALGVLLIDAQKMDKELLEAILWWTKVLNLKDESSGKVSALVALALNDRYRQLPDVWKLDDPIPSKFDTETKIIHYDGPLVCSRDGKLDGGADARNIWLQYFDPKLDAILAH